MKRWFVLRVATRPYESCSASTEKARQELEGSGAEVFIPKRRIVKYVKSGRKHRRGLTKAVWSPVFGSYIFAGLSDTGNGVNQLRQARCVQEVLNDADGHAARLAPDVVGDLKRLYRSHTLATMMEEFPLKRGQEVRIMGGPLADSRGIFQCVDIAKSMVRIFVDCMGRPVPADIHVDDVEPI